MTTIYSDDFFDNEVYDNDEDGDDKLPARHHATIKWLFSDFYSEWSLYEIKKKKNKQFWQVWVDLMIQRGTSLIYCLTGFIFSFISCFSVTFFSKF